MKSEVIITANTNNNATSNPEKLQPQPQNGLPYLSPAQRERSLKQRTKWPPLFVSIVRMKSGACGMSSLDCNAFSPYASENGWMALFALFIRLHAAGHRAKSALFALFAGCPAACSRIQQLCNSSAQSRQSSTQQSFRPLHWLRPPHFASCQCRVRDSNKLSRLRLLLQIIANLNHISFITFLF